MDAHSIGMVGIAHEHAHASLSGQLNSEIDAGGNPQEDCDDHRSGDQDRFCGVMHE